MNVGKVLLKQWKRGNTCFSKTKKLLGELELVEQGEELNGGYIKVKI